MEIIKCPHCGKIEKLNEMKYHLEMVHWDIYLEDVSIEKTLDAWRTIGILETKEV